MTTAQTATPPTRPQPEEAKRYRYLGTEPVFALKDNGILAVILKHATTTKNQKNDTETTTLQIHTCASKALTPRTERHPPTDDIGDILADKLADAYTDRRHLAPNAFENANPQPQRIKVRRRFHHR